MATIPRGISAGQAALPQDVHADGHGSVTISNGGLVQLDGPNSALLVGNDITVGSEGLGMLTAAGGGTVVSESGVIGGTDPHYDHIADYMNPEAELGTGTGIVTIADGSQWQADDIHVGFSGTGSMSIEDGGQVADYQGWIGVLPDAVGTATVSGWDSAWSNTDSLVVGAWGQGDLTIANGGEVTARDVFIGGMPFSLVEEEYNADLIPNGTGSVTVTGSGSLLDVESPTSLYVGYYGNGTLDVNEGGMVVSETAGIGALPGSTGAATVDGQSPTIEEFGARFRGGDASTWHNTGSMFVGGYGNGSLTVSNGGEVFVGDSLYIGGYDPCEFDVESGAYAYEPNGAGTVAVTGDGSLLIVSGLATLNVGYSGNGVLDVNDGGMVLTESMIVGRSPGVTGAVTVRDANSVLLVDNGTVVGAWGHGDLTVSGGGVLMTGGLYVGGFDADANQALLEEFGEPNGTGAVTVTGEGSTLIVNDADSLAVGAGGTGSLTVSAGGVVDSTESYIGGYLKSDTNEATETDTVQIRNGTGTAAVTGPGSTWLNDILVVGAGGNGRLDITDGGVVSSYFGVVGLGPNSVGQVTVSGPNSVWANSAQVVAGDVDGGGSEPYNGTLIVGGWGQGDLLVSNGGRVDSVKTYIGGFNMAELGDGSTDWGLANPAGTGVVTVTGPNSVLSASGGNSLYVGYSSDGTLNILAGGRVETNAAIVGVLPDSNGLVVVDGPGSTLSIAGGLAEPNAVAQGNGEMIIRNGGLVEVKDPNGLLAVGGSITVGSEGQGTLTVSNGAVVNSRSTLIGGYDPDYEHLSDYFEPNAVLGTGTGTVAVSGEGSTLQADGVAVGFSGTGSLSVADGGRVFADMSMIGVMPDVNGVAVVSGPNSVWASTSGLIVGAWGRGELTVADGADVVAGDVYLGGMPFATVDPNHVPMSTGTVTVTGHGSRLRALGTESLYVGYSGLGRLDVNDGGRVESNTAGIGALPGSAGMVTIGEPGELIIRGEGEVAVSTWDNAGSLFVGGYGDGLLTVNHDGQVMIGGTLYVGGMNLDDFAIDPDLIGYDPNGNGAVVVKDGGSLQAYALAVGVTGAGSLDVQNGGQVTAVGGVIGFGPNSVGQVTVDGTGSVLNLTEENPETQYAILGVGVYGQGQLNITNGGQVNTAAAVVGGFDLEDIGEERYYEVWGDPNGTGAIAVTGTDSQLNVTEDLCIGHTGTGSLTVENGGHVSAGYVYFGDYGSALGIGAITGTSSRLNVDEDLYVGYEGAGALTIEHGARVYSGNGFIGYETSGNGAVLVTGEGSLWDAGQHLYVGGDEEGEQGTGVLAVQNGGEVRAGELTVWSKGTLMGDGTVTVEQPTTLHNYGTISPGNNGIGTMTVNGSVVFHQDSTYAVDISNTASDKLDVNGDVTIDGGTVRVNSTGTIVGSREYEIIHASSVTGEFNDLDTALLHFSFNRIGLDYNETVVQLWIDALRFDDPNVTLTDNERAVGGALQNIANGGGNTITNALQLLGSNGDVRHAYDQLSGHSRPPLAPLTAAGTSKFLGTVTSRLQTMQGGLADSFSSPGLLAMAGPDSSVGGRTYDVSPQGQTFGVGKGTETLGDLPWGVWGRAYGLYGDRENERETPGYSYDIYGGSVGLDYQFTDALLGGLVVGMSDGKVNFAQSRDHTDFDAKQVGLYGSAAWEKWYVDAVGSFARLEYDTERYVDLLGQRLDGSFSGYELSAYAEVGRNWQVAPRTLLQPLASLQYSYVSLNSYTESGGSSALSFDKQTQDSIKGSLGARLTQTLIETMGDLRADVQLRGRWVHEFGDNRASVDTSFVSDPTAVFTIHDAAIARDSAVLGVGLAGDLSKHTRVYLDYDTRLNSDETVQVIGESLQYRW
jgi:T5SS/PEP-CTERM-associated repeat protein